MKNYLKWVFPGGAALLILGVIIGIKAAGSPAQVQTEPKPAAKAIVATASYPAPRVSIISQPILAVDRSAIRHSSSLYGASSDRWSHKRSKWHKKSSSAKTKDTADVSADLGVMAADDPKLLKAESTPPKPAADKSPDKPSASDGISPRDPAGA